LSVGFILM